MTRWGNWQVSPTATPRRTFTPDVHHAYDVFGRAVASSNSFAQYEYANSLSGIATNELVAVGTNTSALARSLDAFSRLSGLHAADSAPVYFGYDTENRLAVTSNGAFTVAYAFTADDRNAGYAVTLTNGLAVARAVTRDPHRRHLVTAVSNAVGVSSHSTIEYGHDLLGRVTSRNADAFGYNARSEVSSAVIGADRFNYSYDPIGNRVWSSMNTLTNTYAANRLNQYTLISNPVNPVNPVLISAYDYANDAAGRRVSRNDDAFGYNARSEVISAAIGTNGYAYAYDPIGNRVWSAMNAVTNTYTANRLNQYTLISNPVNPVNPVQILPTYDADGNMRWDGSEGYVGFTVAFRPALGYTIFRLRGRRVAGRRRRKTNEAYRMDCRRSGLRGPLRVGRPDHGEKAFGRPVGRGGRLCEHGDDHDR